MKTILLVCALIFTFQSAISQNKISGIITDKENQPMAGASVSINEINKKAFSDKNGYYEILNLPNGEFKVQISYIGYKNIIKTVFLSGSEIKLNAVLEQTVISTEEIVVTGGYNSTQHENTVNIEVLKLNDLTLKSTPNFAERLTKIAGVDMISKGSGVAKPVIRGLSMNDILLLNNGVRFENYQYSSHHPLGIDEFGTEDVEVIKGPASMLYGSDAIGGVMNFIKEKPTQSGTISGDYNLQMFSNSLGLTNNIGLKAASKNFFAGARFGYKTNADYLEGGGDFVPNSRAEEYSFKSNAGYTGKAGLFNLFFDYNRQNLGLVEDEAIEQIIERGRKPEIFYQQLNTYLVSSQNTVFQGKTKLNLNAAYQNTELIHFGEKDFYELQMKLSTLTYEAKLHLPSDESSEYIIGFQGFNQKNKNINNRETILLPNARTDNYSIFGLAAKTFFERLKLQAGLRYDYKIIETESAGEEGTTEYRSPLNKNYGSFSGSFGAVYNFSDKFLLRTNIAAAYRTPNIAELTSNGPHETRYEIGDRNLIPEKSYELDLSIHYHTDNFLVDASGFYNVINNYIFISPTGDTSANGLYIYKYMQGNSYLYGFEATVHYHPPFIKWLHSEASYSTVTGKQTDGTYLPFIPAHKVNLEIRAETERISFLYKPFFSVNATFALDQKNPAPEETSTAGYGLVDLSAGGSVKIGLQKLSFSFGVNNLFDRKYIDHLSTLKEVGRFNPGRNFTFSMRIPLEWRL